MEPDLFAALLSDDPIERVIILLLAGAVVALYRRANHLADQRVSDIRATLAASNTAMARPPAPSTSSRRGSRPVARLLDLLFPGRRIEADTELQAVRRDAERCLAELRAQSRRLRRVILELHEQDRRRERS